MFISKMKGFAFDFAAAGKKINDNEMKGYILNGIDGDYNPFVSSINEVTSTTLTDMCVGPYPCTWR
jgi:hypothetical protein